ncbi:MULTISPECIES: class D sortase [Clostridium]|uniref:class D sortase n=1 Tax=Clostridium TaxID=1485 RepID=UPI001FA79984|nr:MULTISPECIES: class D sortase [Clostridium]MDU3520725.1 class D sortase [Clostridium saudiense]MDU7453226.1 class D sortase [Clostridium saudiense]MEE0725150.1 class D sortase [Clostridium saudiense]
MELLEKFRKIIGVLLILIGVGIIGTVAYKKIVTSQKQNELLEAFESQLAEGDNENTEEEVNLDSINGYTPIAIMEIPSIKLKQPVVEGITEDVIKYFLGKFPESTMPGEVGNFAVAGHRVSDFTDAFINLYKVKPGDNVIVTTKDGKYTYEVEESFIVEPEQVEVLENADYEKITLITCTIGSKRRVIVTGKLIEKNEA